MSLVHTKEFSSSSGPHGDQVWDAKHSKQASKQIFFYFFSQTS